MDPGRYGLQQGWDNNSALEGYGAVHEPNFRVGSSYDERRFLDERYSRDNIYPRNAFQREDYPPPPAIGLWPQSRRRNREEEYPLDRESRRLEKPYVDSYHDMERYRDHEIDSYQDFDKFRDSYRSIDNYRDHGFDRPPRFGGRDRDGCDDYDYRSRISHHNREDSRERDYDYSRHNYDSDYERGSRRDGSWRRYESRDRDRDKRCLSQERDQSPHRRHDRSRSRSQSRSQSRGHDDRPKSRSPRGRSHGRSNREDDLATPLSFNFSSFSHKQDDNMSYERAFADLRGVIQLTKTTETFGRATYKQPLRLWDKGTGNLADFTTHFSFVMDSQNRSSYGDGLAFFLAPTGSVIPSDTAGGTLGLTKDEAKLNSTANQFVAVEFDIFHNTWDPFPSYKNDHVGIDINSLNSSNAVIWWSDITDGKKNDAWISYNSTTQNLSVIFTGFVADVTKLQYLHYIVDLRLYLPELVTFGFSAGTGNLSVIQSIYSWDFNSSLEIEDPAPAPAPVPQDSLTNKTAEQAPSSNYVVEGGPRRGKNKIGLAVGLSIGGGGSVACLVFVWLVSIVRKRGGNYEEDNQAFSDSMDDEFEKGTGPKKFSYKKLVVSTSNFSDEQKLGEGGFGGVYKGFLKDTNSYIAVKRVSKGSKQGRKEYATEVKIISRLRHRNLVQLLGWCHERKELLLVYEFMPNGSLDSHLFKDNCLLTWEMRYKIAQDLASGLLYLHEEWEQCVVHRDIKSSNVMLDSNFIAKIGDFGLARLVEHAKGSQTTLLAGTMGYMAPECVITGKASKESDVYSFGIVALEIACGRKPINPIAEEGQVYMVQWVWELYGSGKLLEAADPRLGEDFDEQQVQLLMTVGLWCAHPDENLRPSIRQANHALNSEVPLPTLPPKMPVAMYCTPSMNTPISILPNSYGAITSGGSQKLNQSSSYSCNTNSSQSNSSSARSSAALLKTR